MCKCKNEYYLIITIDFIILSPRKNHPFLVSFNTTSFTQSDFNSSVII